MTAAETSSIRRSTGSDTEDHYAGEDDATPETRDHETEAANGDGCRTAIGDFHVARGAFNTLDSRTPTIPWFSS